MRKLKGLLTIVFVAAISPNAYADPASQANGARLGDVCGQIEGPGLWLSLDGDSRVASVDTSFEPPYVHADYSREIEITNRLFQMTGSRICISDAWLENWSMGNGVSVKMSRSSVVNFAPDYKITDVPASHCELFIDKAAVVYVDGYHQRDQRHYALGTIYAFLKILPDRLDGTIRTVRFYGKMWPGDTWVQANKVPAWEGAPDYFSIALSSGSKGSFYVETDKGTRYWLNFNLRPWTDFVVTDSLMESLDQAVGFYGYKYPEHGPDLDVGTLAKTADAFPNLNPGTCR